MALTGLINLSNVQQLAAINLLADQGHIKGKVVIPNCCQVRLDWRLEDAKLAHNVMYMSVPAGFVPTVTVANSIFGVLTTAYNTSLLQTFHPATTFMHAISLRDMRVIDQPYITSTSSESFGTSPSPSLPDEVAVALTFRTNIVGPGGRGRVYIPGYATNALGAGNVVAAAAVTATNAFGQNFQSACQAGGGTFSLGLPARAEYTSSKTGTLHPARAARTEPITTVLCRDNHWDSQRRRGLK